MSIEVSKILANFKYVVLITMVYPHREYNIIEIDVICYVGFLYLNWLKQLINWINSSTIRQYNMIAAMYYTIVSSIHTNVDFESYGVW